MKGLAERSYVSSFFLRVLAALLIVNLGTAAVLIYIAFSFNTSSLSKQVQETITQQVTSFGDELSENRLLSIKKVLKALENSQDMDDFLDSSKAKQLVIARRIEKLFIQIQNDNTDISGLYYYNDLGKLKIAVQDGRREFITSNYKSDNKLPDSVEAISLFKQISSTPLLLSSGNMEWFMPPREVIIKGPFLQQDKKPFLLAALSKLDKSSGVFGGMLLLRYDLGSWLNNLSRVHVQHQSPAWVFNQDGKILLQPKILNSESTFEFTTLPPEKSFTTLLIQSENRIIAFRDIVIDEQGDSLRLAFEVPNKLLLKDFSEANDFFSAVLIISIVLLVVFSYLTSNYLVKPFNELTVARNKLVTAQRLAGLGHWEWSRLEGCIKLSDNAINILGNEFNINSIGMDRFLEKVHIEDRIELKEIILNAVENKQSGSYEYRLVSADGIEKFIHQEIDIIIEEQPRIIGTIQDVTERRESEERIKDLAYHDSVTGLANRTLIHELAQNALQTARNNNRKMAIIFLDLDKFKLINDSMGHDAGDILLRMVADRLLDCVRPTDTVSLLPNENDTGAVGRLGGDEFIIMLSNLIDVDGAVRVVTRVHQSMRRTFTVKTKKLHCGVSMGISVYPEHGKTVEELLHHADAAMYLAKQRGRNRYELYNKEIDALHQERVILENALQLALKNNEFKLFYQPRYDMSTGEIVSFEALIRWIVPEKGIVMPNDFIYIAEENGLINSIGKWVMETAFQQLLEWQTTFDDKLGMSVNISPIQFMSGEIAIDIKSLLKKYPISPNCIELELTENALFGDVEAGVKIAHELKKLGISLSIDDFGTGYSSLKLLRQFPVDTLKIDQSFVQDILTDRDDALIVQSSIMLGQNLGLKVVAEGLSEKGHWHALFKLGCDEAQGFYLNKPLPSEQITELLLNFPNIRTKIVD